MEIESREAVREAVAAGLGLGVVSEAELGHDGRLATLALEPGIETREWIVCPRTRARTRLVRAFLEVVEEVKARGPTVRVTTDTARPD
jgi:DNA-binding transcriptional LysR family regulator